MNSIKELLDSQIKNNKVVLYMKGTPQIPMCGFSAKAVKILKECGINDFLAVNVLENNEIRAGIKEYSNWPTIPQLYVNGQFIGGSDIMLEMFEAKELQEILKN